MMIQQVHHEGIEVQKTSISSIEDKIDELTQSVSQVYKYELLTTNQYLKQMDLILEIFNELSNIIAHQ
jgi:hypothetical protein